jgi:hypothetical protein
MGVSTAEALIAARKAPVRRDGNLGADEVAQAITIDGPVSFQLVRPQARMPLGIAGERGYGNVEVAA